MAGKSLKATGRAMKAGDLKAVRELWRKTPGIGLGVSDTLPELASFLRRNPGLSLIVTAGRKVVGAVLCGHDGRRGYLHHLSVSPKYRHRGLGRAMAAECLRLLNLAGIHRCNIYIFSDNRRARNFWEKAGWKNRTDLFVMQTETGQGCGGKCSAGCGGCQC